MVATNYFTKLV